MKIPIQESIQNELWLLTMSRRIGTDVGEAKAYIGIRDWLIACEDKKLAVQVVDNAMLSPLPIHKLSRALQIFTNDYSFVVRRIDSDARSEDKPLSVPQEKAKGKRAKRITGNGP
jgi:hypothetical protein